MDTNIYILAVDDETHILTAYKDILSPKKVRSSRMRRAAGKPKNDLRDRYQVELADSGEKAVELVQNFFAEGKKFAVGFFDMRMPGMDGVDTIREVLKYMPDLQCVVVTADTDRNPNEIISLFHDPSQFVYLNKPFNSPEISQLALSLSSLWIERRRTEKMLDSIVQASVQAIESRDPTTSGHSERVARLTVALAKQMDKVEIGPYAELHFNRHELETIRYASLLHDFGKIGVREHVLVKAKKLYPGTLEKIQLKFSLEEALGHISSGERQKWWTEIEEANQPSILPSGIQFDLDEIYKIGLISEEEYKFLTIPRGTLTNEERREIENHVNVTYQFLKTIAWTKDFQRVPEIAKSHHEKLDGSGYPDGITEIPVESRMMTISDIFDALTASDRPYKKAVPIERALDIIKYEVDNGKCDAELFRVFVEADVYKIVLPERN